MSNSSGAPSCALPPDLAAWRSLVSRSIAAWEPLAQNELTITQKRPLGSNLQEYHSLDDFLVQSGRRFKFWFFQQRSAFMSQKRVKKWSRVELDDYVLLPALPGFVMRRDCFFVSHFWRTLDHSDPDGERLRLHQAELEPQTWLYIWVDWTCMPQRPRTSPEEAYFHGCLRAVPSIIRNSGFSYFYPPFEPRLWVLYELTEYVLTCSGGLAMTSDMETFSQHINEMGKIGVQATLAKQNYRCSYDRDRQYLSSWLELLVVLRKMRFSIDFVRNIMDNMTWLNAGHTQTFSIKDYS
ncbi:MAG: hypothetical protein M1821_000629 [Bathelium mastoideum]|nr:MAG: hypothetical protein M1821_000629 [Bathelium mastoideum]